MNILANEKLPHHDYKGEIEFIVKDRKGRVVHRHTEPNLIKIFAKDILAHQLGYSKVWDPTAGTGGGAWVDSGIDPDEEFAAKYILLGASFDESGQPLDTSDSRYYTTDPISGSAIPLRPDVGADNLGDLINPVPISEPDRPLKRVEAISFEASYQPADTPLLQDNVRAMNNVVLLETTLKLDEYNGLGTTGADFFTITEVALAAGAPIDTVGACECDPSVLFLEGVGGANDAQIAATANGGATISIDPAVDAADVARIKEGDQIFLVNATSTDETYDTLNQINPYYLVTSKATTGRDVVLDRTPVDSDQNPLTGSVAIYRSTLRLFSQRILSVPFKKSSDFEIIIRWRITFA